jgi:hypothetical protein
MLLVYKYMSCTITNNITPTKQEENNKRTQKHLTIQKYRYISTI